LPIFSAKEFRVFFPLVLKFVQTKKRANQKKSEQMEEKQFSREEYRTVLAKIETVYQEIIKSKAVKQSDLGADWLDNNDLVRILRVSKRQLQNYRDQGVLPFSQNGSKIYYRWEDVESYLMRNYKGRNNG
jgi:hypothetical protein